MRVVLAGTDPDHWCQPPSDLAHQALVSRFLLEDAIVSMREQEWNTVRERLAATAQDPQRDAFAAKLLEILRQVPMSENMSRPPVDAYLDNIDTSGTYAPLVAASCDPAVGQLVHQRRTALNSSKSRNQLYNDFIRPFAATATKARLLDPWAAADISTAREGISWLVAELFADGIKEIEIVSLRVSGINQGVDKEKLKRLWKDNEAENRKLRLFVADPIGDAHDRHLRFFYPDGARVTPVLTLGRGGSVFDSESIGTPPTVGDVTITQQAAEMREDVIFRSNRSKGDYRFPETKTAPNLRGPESLMPRQVT